MAIFLPSVIVVVKIGLRWRSHKDCCWRKCGIGDLLVVESVAPRCGERNVMAMSRCMAVTPSVGAHAARLVICGQRQFSFVNWDRLFYMAGGTVGTV
ncbi:hypothetical protein TIFTF001_030970 [Ficus carica]|uniref:Uncharacterized protein n=1 Tax=Ficus carica TaxID=3494 RepID=A0AA88DUP7_FICCA|nr:hypothetical protein TIFTF001_030970 [Ficus carica]